MTSEGEIKKGQQTRGLEHERPSNVPTCWADVDGLLATTALKYQSTVAMGYAHPEGWSSDIVSRFQKSCGVVMTFNEARRTCVVEVSQQLFFLHESLIQPVSQGLCLHRNLFYRVHPEGRERERETGTDRESDETQNRITEVSLSRNCPHWSVVEAAGSVQSGSVCVCSNFSLFINWLVRQSERETEVLRGGLTGDRQVVELHKMARLEVCGSTESSDSSDSKPERSSVNNVLFYVSFMSQSDFIRVSLFIQIRCFPHGNKLREHHRIILETPEIKQINKSR